MLPAQTYDIIWDDIDNHATSLEPGDLVNVVSLPDDGSPPLTIIDNIQVIKAMHQTSSPTTWITVAVTPKQHAILLAADLHGQLQCYPASQ
jgi:hypothetical protein